eukprot:198204-Amphidinium_carterae.1
MAYRNWPESMAVESMAVNSMLGELTMPGGDGRKWVACNTHESIHNGHFKHRRVSPNRASW